MSGSVSSPLKTAHRPLDADSELKAALAELCGLNLDINVHLKVADALKDASIGRFGPLARLMLPVLHL